MKQRDNLEDQPIDGRDIKRGVREIKTKVVAWVHLAGQGTVAGSCDMIMRCWVP
jgi:hypothetical protein